MKYIFILLLILSTTCGGEILIPECEKLEENIAGVDLCINGNVNSNEVRKTIEWVEKETQKRYPYIKNFQKELRDRNTWIYFFDTNKPIVTGCQKTRFKDIFLCESVINGQNRNGQVLLIKQNDCLGYTAMAHELLHSIEFIYMKDRIKHINDHLTPYLFYEWGISTNNSVEVIIEHIVSKRSVLEFDSCQ